MKVTMVCEICGKTAEKDEAKSNSNWTVYKPECVCGGKTKPKIGL